MSLFYMPIMLDCTAPFCSCLLALPHLIPGSLFSGLSLVLVLVRCTMHPPVDFEPYLFLSVLGTGFSDIRCRWGSIGFGPRRSPLCLPRAAAVFDVVGGLLGLGPPWFSPWLE